MEGQGRGLCLPGNVEEDLQTFIIIFTDGALKIDERLLAPQLLLGGVHLVDAAHDLVKDARQAADLLMKRLVAVHGDVELVPAHLDDRTGKAVKERAVRDDQAVQPPVLHGRHDRQDLGVQKGLAAEERDIRPQGPDLLEDATDRLL